MAGAFPIPFGKYLLTELIAVGGMAEIYRAKIFGVNGFEKQMVVKRILPKYAQNPSFVQMFVDEAKILVSLTHGNIVPVYELGEVAGNYYIAMEYAEGLTALDLLRECYVKGRQLTVAQALYIGAEVAKGLGYAHTRMGPDGAPLGIVHRDLNPRNIVVSPAGEVKILDFGIARSAVKKHQTGSGVIKGTPGYMAPEQVMGHSVDARADQYGLAIVLHELLTVRRLISVKDAPEHRAKLAEGPLPVPSSFRAEIPKSVDDVVMRALSMRPEERFPSALDFEEALRAEIARMGAAVTSRGLATQVEDIRSAPPLDGTVPQARPVGTLPVPRSTNQAQAPAAEQVLASVPSTRPPPAPPVSGPGAELKVEADFTVEKVSSRQPTTQPPSLPVAPGAIRPVTQILAVNDGVEWAQKIGNDAELLALAKVSGLRSKGPQRVALVVVALVLAAAGVWAAANLEEVKKMVERARSGQRAVVGVLVVKSKPAAATVVLDGTLQGKTPIRLENIDIEQPHQLVVQFPDGRETKKVLERFLFGTENKLELNLDVAELFPEPPPPKKGK